MAQLQRPLRGLYAITPAGPDTPLLLRLARSVCESGAVLLQYRNKNGDALRRLHEAESLRSITRSTDTRLIINDDVGLAAKVGADGVHLGRDDLSPRAARERLGPTALIGVSCYADLDRARRALDEGADYIAFGAMYASDTKPQASACGLDTLRAAARLGAPVCAIGGITLERAPALLAAGADMLAVIGDLFSRPDPADRAAAYTSLFHSQRFAESDTP